MVNCGNGLERGRERERELEIIIIDLPNTTYKFWRFGS